MSQDVSIRNVPLRDLTKASQDLGELVESAGFRPDCVVYVETAGRLIASQICRKFDVGGIPLRVQRQGGRLKRWLAPLLAWLPGAFRDLLRVWESRLLWRRMQHRREVTAPPGVDLRGRKVLIVDDAVDTGSSVRLAREWVQQMGASPDEVKVAALTVTTELGRPEVNFHLFDQMCRFPWSSDSRERDCYLSAYNQTDVPPFRATL